MPVLFPTTVDEATTALAAHPESMLLAGGTDAMVGINDGHHRPGATVISVNRIADLRSWRHDPDSGTLTVGAGVTYTELMDASIAGLVPALAEASRTVGSPQIRNAGTLGGNLATSSPAGDGLPVLSALNAVVHLAAAGSTRDVDVNDFMVGVKRTALKPGEIITGVTVPIVEGWQGYAKVGVRNAMVIAVASTCVVVDQTRRTIAVALGSVGPTILRCPDAESFLASRIDWDSLIAADADQAEFGRLVSGASQPITDHRSTADYRRHAVGVLARRLARRAGATS
jgi:CO/xanthine dehydrogenase FAD-binding subunit